MPPEASLQCGRLSFALPFAEMAVQPAHQLLQPDVERLAHPQQCEDRNWPSRLNHLPVPDTEAVGDHVLLGELARGPEGPNAVAQATEEPRIVGRQLSAGTHDSRLRPHEQKHHEQKCVLLWYDPAVWHQTKRRSCGTQREQALANGRQVGAKSS